MTMLTSLKENVHVLFLARFMFFQITLFILFDYILLHSSAKAQAE